MKNQYEDKLDHLTGEEIENLIERYYNGEKNDVLIDEYNIDIRSSLLVKTFPLKIHYDKLCPFCKIPMLSYRQSKSSYSKEDIFCQECKHELNSPYCPCKVCKGIRLEEELKERRRKQALHDSQREIILNKFNKEKGFPIDIEELDIRMKLYISALLRASLSEDSKDILPLNSSSLKLTPIVLDSQYEREVVSFLRNNGLIIFSPNTTLDSVIIEDNEITRYYSLHATYRLNVSKGEVPVDVDELLYLQDIDETDKNLLLTLWLEIGLYECLEYLLVRLDEYNLPSQYIGDKTISAIKEALNYFSISQVFYFIWNASKNAAAFYLKEGITKKHAVNLIAGNILRTMERAIAQGWDVSKYRRDYNYPQSIISEVYFNRVLKIGDKGFDSVAKNYFISRKLGSNDLPSI